LTCLWTNIAINVSQAKGGVVLQQSGRRTWKSLLYEGGGGCQKNLTFMSN